MSTPTIGSLPLLAKHEFNLSWRDFMRMMSAGKPGREKAIVVFLAAAVLGIHGIAYLLLYPAINSGLTIDKSVLTAVTGTLLLTMSLMMSQAKES
ncbi:MAG: hypothetical protein AAF412_09900, partial [Pseudomonadota bacterium]